MTKDDLVEQLEALISHAENLIDGMVFEQTCTQTDVRAAIEIVRADVAEAEATVEGLRQGTITVD